MGYILGLLLMMCGIAMSERVIILFDLPQYLNIFGAYLNTDLVIITIYSWLLIWFIGKWDDIRFYILSLNLKVKKYQYKKKLID